MTSPSSPDQPLAAQLHQQIEQVLTDAGVTLGTYTFVGGGTDQAVYVGDPPTGTQVTGLEVLLARNPERKTLPGFEFVGFILEWPVRLINWDNADLELAANALAQAFFPLADDPKVIPASPDYPEQLVLKFTVDQGG